MSKIAEVTIQLEDGTSIDTFFPFKKMKKLNDALNRTLKTGELKGASVTFDPDAAVGVLMKTHWVN